MKSLLTMSEIRRKPLWRRVTGVLDGRPSRDARASRLKAAHETIDDVLIDRSRSDVAGGELAESVEPADVSLGRRVLVTNLEEMRRDAIHIFTQRSVAKAPEHPRIAEIELQHSRLSFQTAPGSSWAEEKRGRYYVAAKLPFVAETQVAGARRHIITPDT